MTSTSSWSRSKVADICRLQNGRGFKPSEWSTSGYPIIRIQNLNGNEKFNYFSGIPEDRWLVPNGQMLFAWAGSRGVSFGPTIWRGPTGVLNQHIFKVFPANGVAPAWLYLALQHVTDAIESKAHGFKDTLVHVKKSEIEDYEVLVPPLNEQRRIAEIISAWDRTIGTVEALIANAQQQKAALMQALLTGKRRLPGFDAAWSMTTIGAVCDQITERASDAIDLPVLACSKHDGFVESLKYFKKKVFSDDLAAYKVVRRGMIGFPTNHVEEGSIARQDIVDAGLVSPIYCVFEPRAVDGQFLIRLLKTDNFTQRFAAATNASVDRRGSLRWREFAKLPLNLPSLDEQRAIAAVIGVAEDKEHLLAAQADAVRQEKSALMQQLLTGKRRVKAVQREAA
jgi:type I restriction enzyme S subunit